MLEKTILKAKIWPHFHNQNQRKRTKYGNICIWVNENKIYQLRGDFSQEDRLRKT